MATAKGSAQKPPTQAAVKPKPQGVAAMGKLMYDRSSKAPKGAGKGK